MKHIIFVFLFVVLSGLLYTQGWAAPIISSIEGTISDGQSIVITGSGFGTKSPAKPYLWAPFNSGSINPSSLGTVTSWDEIQSMAYDSDEGIGGTGCAKATDNGWQGWTLRVDADGFYWNDYSLKIYIFRKINRNFDITNSRNWKVWRMWSPNWTTPDIYVQSGNGCTMVEGIMESCSWFDGSDFRGPKDVYNIEEIIFKNNTSSSVSDGLIKLYENGVQADEVNRMAALKTKNSSLGMTMHYPVHGVVANETFPSDYRYWADDVYMDITWARIMIGDASIWANCTHKEIQIPTAWASEGNKITVSFNQGSFSDGGAVWLYVIDADGNVGGIDTSSTAYLAAAATTTGIQGFPITIVSSGETSGLVPPGPPNVHDPDESN